MKKTTNPKTQLRFRPAHETNYQPGDYCIVDNPQFSVLVSSGMQPVTAGEVVMILGASETRDQEYTVQRNKNISEPKFHILHEKDLRLLAGKELEKAREEFNHVLPETDL